MEKITYKNIVFIEMIKNFAMYKSYKDAVNTQVIFVIS